MNKLKDFFSDIRNNVIAFAIYIVAYHIVVLPYLAGNLPVQVNAQLLLYISISTIVTQSLGNELAVLYQVVYKKHGNYNNTPDLLRLFVNSSCLIAVGMLIVLPFLNFSIFETVLLSFVSLLTNARFFLQGPLRLEKKFDQLGKANLFYLFGILLAILAFQFIEVNYWLPFLLAEGFSILYLGYQLKKFLSVKFGAGKYFGENRRLYIELVFSTVLNKVPDYADKILVLPILGSENMSAYFAGTVVSKMLFLVVNPINSVLLSWLSSDNNSNEREVINRQLKVNLIVLLLVFLFSFPLTYFAISILYAQFLDIVLGIIVPLSFMAAFTISASLLRVVFLRYYDLKKLKYINLLHIITFTIFAPLGAYLNDLSGFTYGVALSKGIFWLSFLITLYKHNNKVGYSKGN